VLREAAAIARSESAGLQVGVSGADARRAYEQACDLAESGAEALLSFGLAGGLDPRLGPGSVVVANQVLAVGGESLEPEQSGSFRERLQNMFAPLGRLTTQMPELPPVQADAAYEADEAFVERLLAVGGTRCALGPVAGVDRIVGARDEKVALFVKTRALTVDMESEGVARAATERGLPFGVIRVVFDPSNRDLPAALGRTVKPDGSTTMKPVVRALLLNPFELGGYLSVAIDSVMALRALRRVGLRLGPTLLGGL
jgi:nucleoside phosphorylase